MSVEEHLHSFFYSNNYVFKESSLYTNYYDMRKLNPHKYLSSRITDKVNKFDEK